MYVRVCFMYVLLLLFCYVWTVIVIAALPAITAIASIAAIATIATIATRKLITAIKVIQ